MYRYIHAKHHEFRTPRGIAAEHAHPLEDLFANTLSTIAGPLILQTHLYIFWLYISLKLWQSIEAHCGYYYKFSPWNAFPGMDCTRAHDLHHEKFNCNYGGFFPFWDMLMGTYSSNKK